MTAVSVLASKVNIAKKEDLSHLNRIYQYLNTTKGKGIVFNAGDTFEVKVFADAAYMVHRERESRSGMVVLINGGVVATNSTKQKHVTKSSTEAELVSLSDAASWALYASQLLEGQGIHTTPTIYQDNKSVLSLMTACHNGAKGTKHIEVRYFFVKQHFKSGKLNVVWCCTNNMLADIMTKPLLGANFRSLRDKIVQSV